MNQPKLILVIDDIVYNFNVVEDLLFEEKYEFKYAANGLQALKFLSETLPDLILLDAMMPGLDGIEVCKRIKSNSHLLHIPIIMATALDSKQDIARCLEAGADDFISKPIDGLELRARVRSMLRIKQQYDALKAALEMREDMSTTIVHDLRNPIGNIAFACELLLGSNLDRKQKKKVEQIIDSQQRLSALTDDLLIMAKMDSGMLRLNKTHVNINNLVERVVRDFTPLAHHNEIEPILQLSETVENILIDVNLFRRLLENLLSNAIKFSPPASRVIIRVDRCDLEGKIKIQVGDSGMGVKDELKQKIFNKYEIGRKLNNINQIGLGLAFCKMIVEAHRGEIYVEDNKPKGAIFTVQI